jgi:hypothetical protein
MLRIAAERKGSPFPSSAKADDAILLRAAEQGGYKKSDFTPIGAGGFNPALAKRAAQAAQEIGDEKGLSELKDWAASGMPQQRAALRPDLPDAPPSYEEAVGEKKYAEMTQGESARGGPKLSAPFIAKFDIKKGDRAPDVDRTNKPGGRGNPILPGQGGSGRGGGM